MTLAATARKQNKRKFVFVLVKMSATRNYPPDINVNSTFTEASSTENSTNFTAVAIPSTDNSLLSGLMLQTTLLLVVFGNLLVVLSLCGYKRWTAPDVLVLSLSMADLLDSLIGLQTLTVVKYFLRITWQRWLCDVYVTLLYTFRMASGSTVTFMAAERAFLVVSPIKHHTMVRTTRVKKTVLGIWLFALFSSVLPFIGVGQSGFRQHDRSCLFQLVDLGIRFAIIIEVIGCIHLLLTLGCYIAIKMSAKKFVRRQTTMGAAKSRKQSKQELCVSPKRSRKTGREKKAKASGARVSGVQRLNTMMGIVVLVYYISWLPFLFHNLVSLIANKEPNQKISLFAGLISLLHALVNPVLYGKMSQRYRRGYVHVFKTMLMICGGKRPVKPDQGITSNHSNPQPAFTGEANKFHAVDNLGFIGDSDKSIPSPIPVALKYEQLSDDTKDMYEMKEITVSPENDQLQVSEINQVTENNQVTEIN